MNLCILALGRQTCRVTMRTSPRTYNTRHHGWLNRLLTCNGLGVRGGLLVLRLLTLWVGEKTSKIAFFPREEGTNVVTWSRVIGTDGLGPIGDVHWRCMRRPKPYMRAQAYRWMWEKVVRINWIESRTGLNKRGTKRPVAARLTNTRSERP